MGGSLLFLSNVWLMQYKTSAVNFDLLALLWYLVVVYCCLVQLNFSCALKIFLSLIQYHCGKP